MIRKICDDKRLQDLQKNKQPTNQMTLLAKRRSPIQHLLQAHGGEWTDVDNTPLAVRFDDADTEAKRASELGLCDLSALPKIGVSGNGAPEWLRTHGVDMPETIYDTKRLQDGGWVVRTAQDEYLVESGPPCVTVPALSRELGPGCEGVVRLERQEATLLLTGDRAVEVLAQTCAIDLRSSPKDRLILTRAAGASCGILPWMREEIPVYHIWVDNSYAVYLWETLENIVEELGGRVIGAAAIFPDLVHG